MQRSKYPYTLLLVIGALLFLAACGDKAEEKQRETFKDPVDTYIESRVNAIESAKSVVQESNKRTKEQEEAMEALMK